VPSMNHLIWSRALSQSRNWLNHALELQLRRPVWVVLACLGSLVASAAIASRLDLKTEYSALLSDERPSVREAKRVAKQLSAASKVFVVLEGTNTTALRVLADKLAQKIARDPALNAVRAESGVHEARKFLQPRALLFLDRAKLDELLSIVQARVDRAVGAAIGSNLEDEPDEAEDKKLDLTQMPRFIQDELLRHPDGYYQSPDGHAVVVVVHSALRPGQLDPSRQFLDGVKQIVAVESSYTTQNNIRVGYAGDIVTSLSEYGAVRDDLLHVGAAGIALVLLAVYLYFRRISVLVMLGTTIALGCAWTFAFARLSFHHLNVASGFLFSVIAGNGINFAIIFLGRLFEERTSGTSFRQAVETTRRATATTTLLVAIAAAGAYLSLQITEFRGLKDFALIGAGGMLLCWAATYALLPSLVMLFRVHLDDVASSIAGRAATRRGLRYEAPFVWVLKRFPTVVVVLSALLVLGSLVAIARQIGRDPMEYDMKQLFNQVGQSQEQQRLSRVAREVIGVASESSMAIICDRREQAPELAKLLFERRRLANESDKPFEAVHILDDFVAQEQASKIPLAMKLVERLRAANEKGYLPREQFDKFAEFLPDGPLTPYGMDDLPSEVAGPFTTTDGIRGRVAYIEPNNRASEDDVRYLMRWAASFRKTTLASGEVILGSGRVVLFADMVETVLQDIPRTSLLSLVMTTLAVVTASRSPKSVLLILMSLFTGVVWLLGLFAYFKLKLNFFNFIALPITFGIGVDYAVNYVRRYREVNDPTLALARSGGPVILCSLTTILGYLALVTSANRAVHSLGLLAVLGEISCLVSAVLVLPAVLVTIRERRSGRGATQVERLDTDLQQRTAE